MAEKQPWMKLYTKDILADEELKSCSLAARGFFLYLLSLMHRSVRRGYLCQANGQPWKLEQLARMTGCSTQEAAHLSQELLTSGVFSATDDGTGVLYSRRMVRESNISEVRSKAGRAGADATNGKAAKVLPQQNDRQSSGKVVGKQVGKPLVLVLEQQIPSSFEEEKREIELNAPPGMGVQGEGVLPQQNDRQSSGKTESPDLSPEWLAERWVFTKAGHKGRDTVHAVRTTFEDMIRHGCPPSEIAADIDAPSRRLTEPVWDFERRIMERLGLTPGRGKKQKTKAEEHAEILEKVKAAKTGGLP